MGQWAFCRGKEGEEEHLQELRHWKRYSFAAGNLPREGGRKVDAPSHHNSDSHEILHCHMI